MSLSGDLRAADRDLVQITDAAFADAARRSGQWLLCRPGCTQCCVGVFAINQLDTTRLRAAMAELDKSEPQRTARIRMRAQHFFSLFGNEFPGDSQSGILDQTEEAQLRFEDFANDQPCPLLDPATGRCELYEARPMTCRVFGPPVRSEGGLGVCELCFQGATDAEIAACEMSVDHEHEAELLKKVEEELQLRGTTIVASCVR